MTHKVEVVGFGTGDPVKEAWLTFAGAIADGLALRPRVWPSHYFYDENGWRLWQQITQLPEYYVTRAETEIFERYSQEFSLLIPHGPVEIVELGSGCSDKTFHFLDAFDDTDTVYRPIDVNAESLQLVGDAVAKRFPNLGFGGIQGTYQNALVHLLLAPSTNRHRLFLWLGSSIGNMDRNDQYGILQSVRRVMNPDDRLIIGFDRIKSLSAMQAAYDDSEGVTAAFNLNLLTRINRELGGNFNEEHYSHLAHYDPVLKAMVSWLVAKKEQRVRLAEVAPQIEYTIGEGEGIRTEISQKFSWEDILSATRPHLLHPKVHRQDDAKQFSVVVFAPLP